MRPAEELLPSIWEMPLPALSAKRYAVPSIPCSHSPGQRSGKCFLSSLQGSSPHSRWVTSFDLESGISVYRKENKENSWGYKRPMNSEFSREEGWIRKGNSSQKWITFGGWKSPVSREREGKMRAPASLFQGKRPGNAVSYITWVNQAICFNSVKSRFTKRKKINYCFKPNPKV